MTPFLFHFTFSFSDKGRSQKTQTSSPPPGSQKVLQFDSVANAAERVKPPAGFSGNTSSGIKPNAAFPDLSLGASRCGAGAAPVSGELLCWSPANPRGALIFHYFLMWGTKIRGS